MDGGKTAVDEQLQEIVSRIVDAAGLELVELTLRGSRGSRVLRVDIDRAGTVGVTLDECQRISRELSETLDETELIDSKYLLEVSSPGADRPIRTPDDIRRNTGRRVVVTAGDPAQGQPQSQSKNQQSYRGLLLGTDGGHLLLADDEQRRIRIPLEGIIKATRELEL